MRILHVASSYPLSVGGATAPFLEEMFEAQAKQGDVVQVIVPRVNGLHEGTRRGVQVKGAAYAPRPLQVWGYGRSLGDSGELRKGAIAVTPLALTSLSASLVRSIGSFEPDVVHLHWALPQGALAFVLPRRTPVVVSIHGADARFARGRLKVLTRRVLERADRIIAASSAILDFVTQAHLPSRDKARVIPHGANSQLFGKTSREQARREAGLDSSTPVIVAVGRLVTKKGFLELIRSIELMTNQGAHLFVAGDGPERERLTDAIPEKNAGRITLLGHQSRENVARWYAIADVVAIPSIPDGLDVDSGPVVLMEAMAAGRPIVATKIGMATDLVDDDVNGYLVSFDRPEQLAASIDRALASAGRLGQGARQTFETVGDWGRVAAALESVYSEAIAHRLHILGSR